MGKVKSLREISELVYECTDPRYYQIYFIVENARTKLTKLLDEGSIDNAKKTLKDLLEDLKDFRERSNESKWKAILSKVIDFVEDAIKNFEDNEDFFREVKERGAWKPTWPDELVDAITMVIAPLEGAESYIIRRSSVDTITCVLDKVCNH